MLRGPGYADRGTYNPRSLRDWRVRYEEGLEGLPVPWFWEEQGPEHVILPEARLRAPERLLLRMTRYVEEYVTNPPTPPRRSKRQRNGG